MLSSLLVLATVLAQSPLDKMNYRLVQVEGRLEKAEARVSRLEQLSLNKSAIPAAAAATFAAAPASGTCYCADGSPCSCAQCNCPAPAAATVTYASTQQFAPAQFGGFSGQQFGSSCQGGNCGQASQSGGCPGGNCGQSSGGGKGFFGRVFGKRR